MHVRKACLTGGVFFLVLAFGIPAASTPRLAAKYGQYCFLCHTDPGGAGMRNNFGSQYISINELPMTGSGGRDEMWPFSTAVSENISVGGDFRMLSFYTEARDGNPEVSSLLNMEGNFYIAVQPNPKFLLQYTKSLNGRDEIFAIGYLLPWKGYIKVGRFTPNVGIRFADHTSFVRERLGFSINSQNFSRGIPLFVPGLTDTGIGLGVYPGPFHVDVGVYNGSPANVDFDNEKAVSTRIAGRRAFGDLSVILGGSFYRNELNGTSGKIAGGFTMLGFRDIALLGEIDRVEENPDGMPETANRVLTLDAAYYVRKGVDLRVRYDLFQPGDNSRVDEWKSITAGVDLFPYFFLETVFNVRFHLVENSEDFRELDLQVHLWF